MADVITRVREIRHSRGLTQEQLAELSGIDQATISRIESDPDYNPFYRTLNALARVLGVSTDTLVVQEPLPADRRQIEKRTGVPRRQKPEQRSGLDRRRK